jgi:hypothetical protein
MPSNRIESYSGKLFAGLICLALAGFAYWNFESAGPGDQADSVTVNPPQAAEAPEVDPEVQAKTLKMIEEAGSPPPGYGSPELNELATEAAAGTVPRDNIPNNSVGSLGDPYAAGQRSLAQQKYLQRKSELVERVARAEQASRCGVIPKMEVDTISIQGMNAVSEADVAAGVSDYHPDLIQALRAVALKVAREVDQNRGLCSYWRQNPEAVANIRQEAQISLP